MGVARKLYKAAAALSLMVLGAYDACAEECRGAITMYVHIDCPPCKDFKGCKPKNSKGRELSDAELRSSGGRCQWTYKPNTSHLGCEINFDIVYFKNDSKGKWVHPEDDVPSPCIQNGRNVVPCMTKNSCANPALEGPVVPPVLADIVKQCCADCAKPECLCGCSAWTQRGKGSTTPSWSCSGRSSYLQDVVNVDALPACSCNKTCALDPKVCANPPTAECVKLKCEKGQRGATTCKEEKVCDGKARDGRLCCEVNKEECSRHEACLPEECSGEEVCTEEGCYSSGCANNPMLCCSFKKCFKHPECAKSVSTACRGMKAGERSAVPECAAVP